MKKNECFLWTMTVYEKEGMLSTSPFARVTLTRKVDENTWAGYMEETLGTDGPRTNVKVKRVEYDVIANDDYSNITLNKSTKQNWAV